jgi:hypothetical protein
MFGITRNLERCDLHLLRGHYSPIIATTNSFADPDSSSSFGLSLVQKSLQVATSPCCHLDLPDVISTNLSSDASSPAPAVPRSAFACFFLRVIGLPQVNSGSASSFCSMYTTSHGERFRGCRYFIMLRPLSLLASQVVPTATNFPVGQPRLLHPGRTYIVTFVCTGYANRPKTGN